MNKKVVIEIVVLLVIVVGLLVLNTFLKLRHI